MPMSSVLRTRTISESPGFMKMLISARSDQILGFTAFGVEASELLAAVQTAMLGSLPYTILRDGIYTHPTISEGARDVFYWRVHLGPCTKLPQHRIAFD